jgi:hypothetical protein
MHRYLTAYNDDQRFIEYSEGCIETVAEDEMWIKEIHKVFGKKACLSYDNMSDLRALEQGYNVISNLPWGLRRTLENVLDYSNKVTKPESKNVPLSTLDTAERALLKEASSIAEYVAELTGLDTCPIKVFIEGEENQMGYYRPGDDVVGIHRKLLNDSKLADAVGTLVHEYIHKTTSADDNTRSFENALCDVISTLALQSYTMRERRTKISAMDVLAGMSEDICRTPSSQQTTGQNNLG